MNRFWGYCNFTGGCIPAILRVLLNQTSDPSRVSLFNLPDLFNLFTPELKYAPVLTSIEVPCELIQLPISNAMEIEPSCNLCLC